MNKEELQRLAESFLQDISQFAQFFFPETVNHKTPSFHQEIYDLVRTEKRLVLAAPRGFAKSTIVSKIYPIWLALFALKKDICIISSSEGLAVEHLRWIKMEIENNPKIHYLFGNLQSDKWTETHIILKHRDGSLVNIRAKGAGAQIRGFRPDCIILDDLETDESVESEEQRKKLKDWILKACLNTLLPEGQFLLIGTVIHPLSVLADLLSTPNNWVKRKFRAYKDGVKERGSELWPDLWTHEKLKERENEIGSFRFASEYMNDPKMDGSAPIKEENIRYWETLPNQLSMAIAIDPAYSEDTQSDYKVAVLVGIDQNNNRYLIDYVRTHEATGEFISQAFNLYQRFSNKCHAFGVPDSGTEKEFYRTVCSKAAERRLGIPITPLTNTFHAGTAYSTRNKIKRIVASLQPWFEKGQYYIHPNHYEAREELLTIGASRWDDLVDAMAYAEQLLTPHFYEDQPLSNTPSMAGKSSDYGIEY